MKSKFTIAIEHTSTWEVVVEAEHPSDALEVAKKMDVQHLEPDYGYSNIEIVDEEYIDEDISDE